MTFNYFLSMTFFFNSVKKFWLALLMLLLLLSPNLSYAQAFIVNPVSEPEDVRLLSCQDWPKGRDQIQLAIKLSYIRGLIDAMQYVNIAPGSANEVLEKLAGYNIIDLATAVDNYYLQNLQEHQLPPASVVFRILTGPAEPKNPENSAQPQEIKNE